MRLLPALVLVVFLVGSAQAISIQNHQVFAKTRSNTVEWKAAPPLEANALIVNATALALGDAWMDFLPSTGTLTVNITTWTNDRREFTLSNTDASTFTFNMTNPGLTWTLYTFAGAQSVCLPTTTLCQWSFTSNTAWNFTLKQPASGSSAPDPGLPEAGAGADSISAPSSGGSATIETHAIPPPSLVFPRFQAIQWLVFGIGLLLVVSSSRRTRAYLPPFLRLPGSPLTLLLAGAITITLVYLTTAPAP